MSNKRTDESSLGKSASVPLMHHIESDVRLFNDPAPNQQEKKNIFSFELGIGSYLITPLHLHVVKMYFPRFVGDTAWLETNFFLCFYRVYVEFYYYTNANAVI